jgi:hypothetical protein
MQKCLLENLLQSEWLRGAKQTGSKAVFIISLITARMSRPVLKALHPYPLSARI